MTTATLQDRFLLYIDILGFSDLVEKDARNAHRLYLLIDDMQAHRDAMFRTLVFSDTILVYNITDPLAASSKQSAVMFLIELAQDLFYRLAGKGYFFRAVLVYGELEHRTGKNFDRIYGKGLISAYRREKKIKCAGLFIDDYCQKHNVVFPSTSYESGFNFVYLNQVLDRFCAQHAWPMPATELQSYDYAWRLAKDVAYLKTVYMNMRTHPKDDVRTKMRRTWQLYHNRYPEFLHDLAANKFKLSVISPDFDWSPFSKQILVGHRGFGLEPPSLDEFKRIVEAARLDAQRAAEKAFKELYGDREPGKPYYAPCGGAALILDVDGRSKIGRFLREMSEVLPEFNATRWPDGLHIYLSGVHSCQERDVDIAAQRAILSALQDALHLDGLIKPYWD